MTYYDDIYEIAVDNHYLITTRKAEAAGIPGIELAKLAYRGRLEHMGRGLYRLTRHVPSESDPYAIAVALIGEGAYLWGESVIALLGLAPTDPGRIYVATPRRVRMKLPRGLRLEKANPTDKLTIYEGISSQHITDAIPAARKSMMDERLREAARRAREEGYLTSSQLSELERSMQWQ